MARPISAEYFFYFSFFLVVSALLIAYLFFALAVEQRAREVGLLAATGFPPSRIRRQFLAEGAWVLLVGTVLGVAGAVGYGALIMLGLRTWWVGAVGTTALRLHVEPPDWRPACSAPSSRRFARYGSAPARWPGGHRGR